MDDPGIAQLELYLDALAGAAPASAYFELRHRVGEQMLAAEFHAVDDRDGLIASVRSRSPRTDVYIGCAPRSRRSGTRNDIAQVWVLWAECDGAAAAQAAKTFEPRPPIVIASGSGPNLHAYWPLLRPLTARAAEVANLRLAHALGADLASYDAARILRPPGTLNHKRHPPTRVEALRLEATIRFDVTDVVAHAPEIDGRPIERRWNGRGERDLRADPLLRIPPVVYIGALLGVRPRVGAKVACPFHADQHPSLHVYSSAARGWCCFSCGRGGSIYDLAAALWGMGTRGQEFRSLRRRLTTHFSRELSRPAPGLER
jgi:hypothetical protein